MESGIIASHINIYVDINQLDFELESEQSQVVLNLMNQIKRANLEYNQIQQKIQQLEEEDSRIAAPHHRTLHCSGGRDEQRHGSARGR